MLALLFALGRFLDVFGASCCVCGRSWSVYVRLGALRARFWRGLGSAGHGFGGPKRRFFELLACKRGNAAQMLRPYKTVAGAAKIKVFYISPALCASKKRIQNRSRSLSNRASHKDGAKNWSSGSPGSILEGSGTLLGGSWPAFERSWASLGPS